MDCPLCDPNVSRRRQAELWPVWVERGAAGVVAELLREDPTSRPLQEREVTAHFRNHRTVQGKTARLPREEALELTGKLPERGRAIIRLLSRVRPLSAEQIGSLYYLYDKPGAALIAANRQLRSLCAQGFLYRVHLEHLPGDGVRPASSLPPLFFPSERARAYLAELRGGEPPRKGSDWVEGLDDLDSFNAVGAAWRRSELVSTLYRQMPERTDLGRAFGEGPGRIHFSGERWLGFEALPFRVEDPMRLFRSQRFDGAFELEVGAGGLRTTLLYLRDRGTRDLERLAEDLRVIEAFPRTRPIYEAIGFAPAGHPVQAVVLCESPERLARLVQLTSRHLVPPQSAVVCAEAKTAAAHAFTKPIWHRLFQRRPSGPGHFLPQLLQEPEGQLYRAEG